MLIFGIVSTRQSKKACRYVELGGLSPQEMRGVEFKLSNVYLDPKSMQNNGLCGCYFGFRAIVLHTLGI